MLVTSHMVPKFLSKVADNKYVIYVSSFQEFKRLNTLIMKENSDIRVIKTYPKLKTLLVESSSKDVLKRAFLQLNLPVKMHQYVTWKSTTSFIGIKQKSLNTTTTLDLDSKVSLVQSSNLTDQIAQWKQDLGITALEDMGYTGASATVAIIDSGIEKNQYVSNIIESRSFTNNTATSDLIGHGTAVASIVQFVAPKTQFVSYKVAELFGNHIVIEEEWLLDALNTVLAKNKTIDIVNLSLGATKIILPLKNQLQELVENNITIIAAVGNDGPFPSSVSVPAGYPEVISVGGLYNLTSPAAFTSVGPTFLGTIGVDLLAPAVSIPAATTNGNLVEVNGTSFSAPWVTGVAALLKDAIKQKLDPLHFKVALLKNAIPLTNVPPMVQGNGRLYVGSLLTTYLEELIYTVKLPNIRSRNIFYRLGIVGENVTFPIEFYFSLLNGSLDDLLVDFRLQLSSSLKDVLKIKPYNLQINPKKGLNLLNISFAIPTSTPMNLYVGNVSIAIDIINTSLSSGNNVTTIYNVPVKLSTFYSGGRFGYIQLYENETFYQMRNPLHWHSFIWDALRYSVGYEVFTALGSHQYPHTNIGTIKYHKNDLTSIISSFNQSNTKTLFLIAGNRLNSSNFDSKTLKQWLESDNGGSLVLVLPPFKLNSNAVTTLNAFLKAFNIKIDTFIGNFDSPELANTQPSTIIGEIKTFFPFIGYELEVINDGSSNLEIIATTASNKSAIIAWEHKTSKKRLLVFGSDLMFSNEGLLYTNQSNNLANVFLKLLDWVNEPNIPSINAKFSTFYAQKTGSITLEIKPSLQTKVIGTIITEDQQYYTIEFKKIRNNFVAKWQPPSRGKASLWLNIMIEGYSPFNGGYTFDIRPGPIFDFYTTLAIISVLTLLLAFVYLYQKRQLEGSFEQTLKEEYERQKRLKEEKERQKKENLQLLIKKSLPTKLRYCPNCGAERYSDDALFCYNCGKEF